MTLLEWHHRKAPIGLKFVVDANGRVRSALRVRVREICTVKLEAEACSQPKALKRRTTGPKMELPLTARLMWRRMRTLSSRFALRSTEYLRE